MSKLSLLCSVIFITVCAGCQQAGNAVDIEKERQALLAVYQTEKNAHRNTAVESLMENAGERFISASQGKIYSQSRQDVRQFFESYFRNATYQEYDDLQPPVVRVSADGSMGWVLSRLRARRTQIDENGAAQSREFVYAGIMVYEKRDGKWLRVANVSTFE